MKIQNDSRMVKIPVSEATTPRTGWKVIVNEWWVVTPDNEIMLWDGVSPQSNADKRIPEMLIGKYEGCTIQQLEAVYIDPAPARRLNQQVERMERELYA